MAEVELPIRNVRGQTRPALELLEAELIGSKRYRLTYSPGMVEGLAAGDEFELTLDDLGYRVLKRGGNVCAWFSFATAGQNRGPDADFLTEAIEAIGGRLDGGGHYNLVYTIPIETGFPAIELILDGARSRHAGSSWMFGNVYDPRDGKTPLGWW
jgi:hypothetical protein